MREEAAAVQRAQSQGPATSELHMCSLCSRRPSMPLAAQPQGACTLPWHRYLAECWQYQGQPMAAVRFPLHRAASTSTGVQALLNDMVCCRRSTASASSTRGCTAAQA